MLQRVKDLTLSLQWLGSLLCRGFDSYAAGATKKKKKKNGKKGKKKKADLVFGYSVYYSHNFFWFVFVFVCLFRAAPVAYGGSQASG